jgi:hypothetical protein
VEVDVGLDNHAQIIEKFYIFFPNDDEKLKFRDESLIAGADQSLWSKFDSKFIPSIGPNSIKEIIVSYNEGSEVNPTFVSLSYFLTEPLFYSLKETTFMKEFVLSTKFFTSSFYKQSLIIPDRTTISIILPPGADLGEDIEPIFEEIGGQRKKISWKGHLTSKELKFSYLSWKRIDIMIDLNTILNFLFSSIEGQIISLFSIILIIVIIFKRKSISSSIESFVENNSKFD